MAVYLLAIAAMAATMCSADTTWSESLVLADCGIGRNPGGGSTSRQLMYYSDKAWGKPDQMAEIPWDGSYPWRTSGLTHTLPNGDEWIVIVNNTVSDPDLAGFASHKYDDHALMCWSRHADGLYTLDDGTPCSMAFICDHAPPPTPSPTSTKPKPTPTPSPPKPQATIDVQFSTKYVEFDGHIDPRWWFDNRILSSGAGPQQCSLDGEDTGDSHNRMPKGYSLTYNCWSGDEGEMQVMRAALNGAVDGTIDNSTAKDEDRFFMHTEKREVPPCNFGVCPPSRMVPVTRFARWGSVVLSGQADEQYFPKGHLSYTIKQNDDGGCKVCSFLGAAGGGTAAAAGVRAAVLKISGSVAGPAAGLAGAVVTLACLGAC